MRSLTPTHRLLIASVLCVAGGGAALAMALAQPSLGLTLQADFERDEIVVIAASGPSSSAVFAGERLVSVGGMPERLEARDLIEEPDFFDRYEEMDAFFARQTVLAAALRAEEVELRLDGANGIRSVRVRPQHSRPLSSLPPVFWFQLFAGGAGFLVGAWVFSLRPKDVGVRCFAVMSAMFPLFTVPAAIYSTRELALDGALFRVLSSLNHAGALLYGAGLVALFLCFPRPLVRPRWLWVLAIAIPAWLLADIFRWAPDQDWGYRIAVSAEMLTAVVLGAVQWRKTRGDVLARATLRWFSLSMLVGSGLFIATTVGSSLFGMFPPLAQGYAFGFFLLMDVGLALGLRRYRLFELDEWAFRILLWCGGAVALFVLDGALLVLLHLQPDLALGLALMLAGFLYLPLRSLLFRRLLARRAVDLNALFPRVLEVSFAPTDSERERCWRALWQQVFDPLHVEPHATGTPEDVTAFEDGLCLEVPSTGAAKALVLRYPWQGKGLFGPRQVELARQLLALLRHADGSRAAYERGVREERQRIAADLHDDVGARLLSALNEGELDLTRARVRQAMGDIRSIIGALVGQRVSLEDALADLRHETAERLQAAGIALVWPVDSPEFGACQLDASVHRHLRSMVRELTSNAIRHSRAGTLTVEARREAKALLVQISDDGVGFGAQAGEGHGLANLQRRAERAGGSASLQPGTSLTQVALRLPILAGGPSA